MMDCQFLGKAIKEITEADVTAAVKRERERCAQVCSQMKPPIMTCDWGRWYAAKILEGKD